MASQEKTNAKGWDKVVQWYAKNAYAVNIIYSVGASVVIVGALFKILHWPGASYVLMAGMFTESFLFILGIFEKPHVVYNWENIYPELIGHEPRKAEATVAGANTNGKAVQAPDIEFKALEEGIKKLTNATEQLSSIGAVATAANGLTDQLNKAGVAAQQFAGSQEKLVSASEQLGGQIEGLAAGYKSSVDGLNAGYKKIVDGLNEGYQTISKGFDEVAASTKDYSAKVAGVSQQVASVNALYELQLKELQNQNAAFKAQTEKVNGVNAAIDKVQADAKEIAAITATALAAGKEYEAAQKKLAQQVADLNKVYGNMLNAIA